MKASVRVRVGAGRRDFSCVQPGSFDVLEETHVGALYAIVVPQEKFRFVAWGGATFVPVSAWATSGHDLCAAAAQLRWNVQSGKWPEDTTVRLVSSTRGWLGAVGTPAQWFDFLGCKKLEPWKSFYEGKAG